MLEFNQKLQKLDKPTLSGGFMATKEDADERFDLPYLDVCEECGKHGRVVVPGRIYSISIELVTQDDAIQWSEIAVGTGLMEQGELMEIVRQVKISSLPVGIPDVAVTRCNTYHIRRFEDDSAKVLAKVSPMNYHVGNDARH